MFLLRYKQENIIIISVPTGRQKPYDIFSYLRPVLVEILAMEKHGLNVTSIDGKFYSYKVRLCLAIGDIPGVAELCKHSGHMSYKGCRICSIDGKKIEGRGGIYFSNIDEAGNYVDFPILLKSDYKSGNKVYS